MVDKERAHILISHFNLRALMLALDTGQLIATTNTIFRVCTNTNNKHQYNYK